MKFKMILFIIICTPTPNYAGAYSKLVLLESIGECLEPIADCLHSLIQKDTLVGTFHNQTQSSIKIFATVACYCHATKTHKTLPINFQQEIKSGEIYQAVYSVNRFFDIFLNKELYPETVLFKLQDNQKWITFSESKQPRNKHIVFKEELEEEQS